MSRVPDEVEAELRKSFTEADIGGENLLVVDSTAHACIRRVLGRRGLAPYRYRYVWPVICLDVLAEDDPDTRLFLFDVRELVSGAAGPRVSE